MRAQSTAIPGFVQTARQNKQTSGPQCTWYTAMVIASALVSRQRRHPGKPPSGSIAWPFFKKANYSPDSFKNQVPLQALQPKPPAAQYHPSQSTSNNFTAPPPPPAPWSPAPSQPCVNLSTSVAGNALQTFTVWDESEGSRRRQWVGCRGCSSNVCGQRDSGPTLPDQNTFPHLVAPSAFNFLSRTRTIARIAMDQSITLLSLYGTPPQKLGVRGKGLN